VPVVFLCLAEPSLQTQLQPKNYVQLLPVPAPGPGSFLVQPKSLLTKKITTQKKAQISAGLYFFPHITPAEKEEKKIEEIFFWRRPCSPQVACCHHGFLFM
jgi:hypothetical protein